ncbi:hypothetical protein [Microbacterium lacus]|uniref:hypothetical protein n=1 Tax=Microbacterium lacus TaxID=415217 RepID=UPI000C2BDD62|nr:hypothetical protein [Microbacterium lacus]
MNDLERKEALERELARREAKKSNSARQAAYVTRGSSDEEPAEDRAEREPAWGDDGERSGRGGSASRRQAARVTRGASRRGDS